MMKVETILATEETKDIIKNLYPLYLYDLSEIYGDMPNQYGIFEENDMRTLAEQYEVQNNWFEHRDKLFPFLIMVDGIPSGFYMISGKPVVPKGADYYFFEAFLIRSQRGKGIAEIAAGQIFDRFKGKWELYTGNKNNERAQKHWRKVIGNYTNGEYEETTEDTKFAYKGMRSVFRFEVK